MFKCILGQLVRCITLSRNHRSQFDLGKFNMCQVQNILLLSYYVPCIGHAGGLRVLDLYRKIRELAPSVNITLLARTDNNIDWGFDEIYEIFDEVYLVSKDDFSPSVLKRFVDGKSFDCIDLQFHQSGKFVSLARNMFVNARIIFSPLEIQSRWLWERVRTRAVHLDLIGLIESIYLTIQEIYYANNTDLVVCVSPVDEREIKKVLPHLKSIYLPTCVPNHNPKPAEDHDIDGPERGTFNLNETLTVVYFAHWGSGENMASLQWYIHNVHPLVKAEVFNYKLVILGRGMISEACDKLVKDSAIELIGEIEDPSAIFQRASVGISPSIIGGGMKGKIHQYARYRLPCVASFKLGEDLLYEQGSSILFADNAGEFAEHCVKLLNNPELRNGIGDRAYDVCSKSYSWESYSADIRNIYGL